MITDDTHKRLAALEKRCDALETVALDLALCVRSLLHAPLAPAEANVHVQHLRDEGKGDDIYQQVASTIGGE